MTLMICGVVIDLVHGACLVSAMSDHWASYSYFTFYYDFGVCLVSAMSDHWASYSYFTFYYDFGACLVIRKV